MEADAEQRSHIRKLRKKLRQIENLEQLNRPLNEDEREKVLHKKEIRTELLEILEAEDDEIETARYEETKSEDNILIDFTPDISELETQDSDELNNDVSEVCLANVPNIPSAPPLSPKRVNVFYEEEQGSVKNKTDTPRQQTKATTPQATTENIAVNWKKQMFRVRTMKGHNDVVNGVAVDKDLVLSCSRDTTVKVWDAVSGEEVGSLRGHTSSVTCIVLLSEYDGAELCRYMRHTGSSRIAISGGVDCNLKVWSVLDGKEIKSIYVYNGISSLAYLPSEVCILTGAEGGKLELWDAVSSQNLVSLHTDDDLIPHIKVFNQYVYTSSPDGIVSVWEVLDRDIKLVFSSEKLLYGQNDGCKSTPRKIRSLEVIGNNIYYGDDGVNVKVLNWKSETVKKFVNHICEFGATDAITFTGNEVICSSYDLDTGYGTMNVYKPCKKGHAYMTSLGDGSSSRIVCIACTKLTSGELRIVTAGTELKVWDTLRNKESARLEESDTVYVKTVFVPEYEAAAQDSDLESSESESGSDCSDAAFGPGERTYIPKEIGANYGLWRWCEIL